MPFNKHDLLTVLVLWVDVLEAHFERNSLFPSLSG
jgi:hypothetical protein